MVEENRCQSRNDLLDDIKRGSRLLEQQRRRFKSWIGDRRIVSFIEMQQTKKLQKVGRRAQCDFSLSQISQADGAQQHDGTWARTGEYITVVSKDSALLGLPQVEKEVEVEGNHTTMVKFSSRNADYAKVLGFLHKFERGQSCCKKAFLLWYVTVDEGSLGYQY